MRRRVSRAGGSELLLAVVYAVAMVAGRATRLEETQLALVWPAAAVGYVWLQWAWEHRRLHVAAPALAGLTALTNWTTGVTAEMSLVFAVANVLLALVAVLVVRGTGRDWRLRTGGDLAGFVAGCVAGAGVSAAVGPVGMWLLLGADLPTTVLAWVLRNACNTFVLGALVLRVADRGWPRRRDSRPLPESLLTLVVITALYVAVFGTPAPLPLTYVVLPLTMWVAIRFHTTHAAAHVLFTGVLVVLLTAADRGPFAGLPPATRVFLAQGFIATVGLVALTLALHRDERQHLLTQVAESARRAEEQAALLTTVLETVDVGVVACDADGRLTLFNRAARQVHGKHEDLGVPLEQWASRYGLFEADGATPLQPERVPLARALLDGQVRDALITVSPGHVAPRVLRADGRAMRDAEGVLLGAVVAHTDITELLESERQFRSAFEQGPTPSARLDARRRITQVNPAVRRMLARRSVDLLGSTLVDVVLERDRVRLDGLFQRHDQPVEVRLLRPDGSTVWCEVSATSVRDGHAGDGLLVQMLDVQARKLQEQRLEDAARTDRLTGIGNRQLLEQRLALLEGDPHAAPAVLAYLDLDGFKAVNDAHGHAAGDEVLRVVGRRLAALVRAEDTAVRLGGDEFVLLCSAPTAAALGAVAADIRDRIAQAVAEPVAFAGRALHVGVSVGIQELCPGGDLSGVLEDADRRMYEDKRARRTHSAGAPAAVPRRPSG